MSTEVSSASAARPSSALRSCCAWPWLKRSSGIARSAVDALFAQAPGRDVSVLADPFGLQQAAALHPAAGQADHSGSGQGQRLLVRQPLDRGLHAGAVRHVQADGQVVGPGRMGGLRLLRLPLPILLGPAAVPGRPASGAAADRPGRASSARPSRRTWPSSGSPCCAHRASGRRSASASRC